MLPSRGLTQASRGLLFQRQVLARAGPPVRSIPPLPASASARHLSTGLRSHGRPSAPLTSAAAGLLSRSRLGTASVLSSSQGILLSARRFASTEATSTPDALPTGSASPAELSSDFSAFSDLDGPSLLDIPERMGYLAQLGLDYGWGPTSMCQWVLEHLHITAGLPWWGAIAGCAVAIRIVMAYPALIAQHESVKSREMRQNPLYKETQQKYMMSMAQGAKMSPADLMEMRMQMKLLQEQAGVKMWKMFLPMLQFPFAIGMFKLCRGMSALPVPGLENAGTLWFTDLTMPDPFYVLPCVSAVMMIFSMQRALPFMAAEQANMMRRLPWILGPIGIIVTLKMAASVQLFLAMAAIMQYLQTTLWHMPIIRRLCGLPPLDIMIENTNYLKQSGPTQTGPGGIQYQPPRTIKTTASEATPSSSSSSSSSSSNKEERPQFENPLTFFRDMRQKMTDKVNEYKASSGNTDEKKAANEYEARRIREENEKYWARRDEHKWRQEQKKNQKKR